MLKRFPRISEAVLFLGLGLVAAALFAISVAGSVREIGQTFPGFVVWDNLVVVALGRADWTGIAADVPFRARVTEVDGRPVTTRAELLAKVREDPPGETHRYGFESLAGRASRDVEAMVFSATDYAATMVVYLLNGLAFLAIGLAVFYLKPESGQSQALLAFGGIWGLTLILAVDLFTTGRFQAIYFLLEALSPAAILHLGLAFPEVRRPLRNSNRPLWLIYGLALIVGLTQSYFYRRSYPALLAVNNAVYLAIAGAGVVALTSIILGAFRADSPLTRRRARVVLAGAIMAFLIPLLALLAFLLLGRPVSFSLLTLTGFVYPLSIGYAVARHDLFEADRFVKRSLAWAVITAIVSLSYVAIVLVADRLALGFAITETPFFPVAFVLIALATIVPLRDRVQRGVDRLFYRSRVDYKQTVVRVSEQMTTLLSREAIVWYIVTTARDVLGIESVTLWEREEETLIRRGETFEEGKTFRIAGDDPGLALFESRRGVLSSDEVAESPLLRPSREALTALFGRLGARLLVPLMREGRVKGLLAVGEKGSGSPLSSEDVDVLRTLANEAAVALANASAVQKLREAQQQLIQSERLAAIGELSAAVAHGIRNPLAGMRMAAQLGLEDSPPEHPVREYLEDVLTEVDKLEGQVRGILNFARPFEPNFVSTDLGNLFEELLETLRGKLESKRIEVSLKTAKDLPRVAADPAHLAQTFQALVVNAMEAIGEAGRIVIDAFERPETPDAVTVAIEDTGPGVPPETRERIFQLFMTTKSTGTGLGLAVVRKIIERHGGTIIVTEGKEGGARFVMTLPKRQGATT